MQELEKKDCTSKPRKQNVLLKNSCIISVILCFITHAYAYFNATFFHDRSRVFYPTSKFDSASRARWMQQFINALTAFDYLPWLCGALAIIFLTFSIYMIADILEIAYIWNLSLIAGICIANESVVNAHLYWAPEILVALPFALASVWIWRKEDKHIAIRFTAEALFVGLSLASYGAYTSVAPCIVVISLFFELLDNQGWLKALRRGIEYVAAFGIGMVFYYIVLRLFLHFQELTLTAYMGRDRLINNFPDLKEILELMKQAWYSSFIYLNEEEGIRLILALSCCIFIAQVLRQNRKEFQVANLLMMLLFIAIFPLCTGLIYVMAFGSVHWLMRFAYIMPYIAIITLLDREEKMFQEEMKKDVNMLWGIIAIALTIMSGKALNTISGRMSFVYFGIIVCAVLYTACLYLMNRLKSGQNKGKESCVVYETVAGKSTLIAWVAVVTILIGIKMYTSILNANIAYMKCDEIDRATSSFVTRLLGRIEDCEGFEGNEEIVFIGDVHNNNYVSATDPTVDSKWEYLSDDIFISEFKNGITYNSTLYALLKTNAGCMYSCEFLPLKDCSVKEQWIIGEMPCYPADGSIKKIEENIIVKLSDE